LDYQLRIEASDLNFYIFEDSWKFVGCQDNFEVDYEFKDQLSFSVILHALDPDLLEEEVYPQLINKINSKRNFKDLTIANWLCGFAEIINVICIKDVYGFDVNNDPDIENKRFIYRNIYQGVKFYECPYLLIGEKITWQGGVIYSVNGRIIETFIEECDAFENFKDHFFIMRPEENSEMAWKRYMSNKTGSRFGL
jgi:hypothetical protein